MENLAVIIPVYNEEEIIEEVINDWVLELNKLKINYKIFAYNDGSKDNTKNVLEKIVADHSTLIVINKENSGHGPTILKGYKENVSDYTWIFQTDSDNEMGTDGFKNLWEKRSEYDFLIAQRANRKQPLIRKIISLFSRVCVRIFYGSGPKDINCPYRLMKSEKFIEFFKMIPADTFAPNVIISGIVAKKKLKFYEYPVSYSQRKTGEVSIKKFKLLKAAVKSFCQTIVFSFIIK